MRFFVSQGLGELRIGRMALSGWAKALMLVLFMGPPLDHSAQAESLKWSMDGFDFATKQQASDYLAVRDDFIIRLSPFDRSSRMKVSRGVTEQEFLKYISGQALDWTDGERAAVQVALIPAIKALNLLSLPAPRKISFIETTGSEEGEAAYTRGDEIVIPKAMLHESSDYLRWLVAHELFHVISRNNPDLRERMYNAIGFFKGGEIILSPDLAIRKITNPDAPVNDHFIRVTAKSKSICAVPVLISRTERYDENRGGVFFEYADLRFFATERPFHSLADGELPYTLLGAEELRHFFEQIGRNTGDIIHPEEILADNFTFLLDDRQQPKSPDILVRMRRAIGDFVESRKAGAEGSSQPVTAVDSCN